MDSVIVSWSLENWITVVLMVAVFFVLLVIVSQGVNRLRGKSSAASA